MTTNREIFFVYLAQLKNGSIYTGFSRDVLSRIDMHNDGQGGAYTRRLRPVALLGAWAFPDAQSARRVEFALKKLTPAQKLALLVVSLTPAQLRLLAL